MTAYPICTDSIAIDPPSTPLTEKLTLSRDWWARRRHHGDAGSGHVPVRGNRHDRLGPWRFRPDPPPCLGIAVIRDGIHRIAMAKENCGVHAGHRLHVSFVDN